MEAVLPHIGLQAASKCEIWDSEAFRHMKPIFGGWLKRIEKVY